MNQEESNAVELTAMNVHLTGARAEIANLRARLDELDAIQTQELDNMTAEQVRTLRAHRKAAEIEADYAYEFVLARLDQHKCEIKLSSKKARYITYISLAKTAAWVSLAVLLLTLAYHVK